MCAINNTINITINDATDELSYHEILITLDRITRVEFNDCGNELPRPKLIEIGDISFEITYPNGLYVAKGNLGNAVVTCHQYGECTVQCGEFRVTLNSYTRYLSIPDIITMCQQLAAAGIDVTLV